jgi:4-amino-4-deoxy-L-arabinose transferase-like glycosyltransferase
MFLRRHSEPRVLSADRPRHPRVVGGRHVPAVHSLLAPLRDPAHRADVWPLLTLLCVGALLWAPRLAGPIDFRYDAGVYYILGTSLAEGNGYRLSNEPGDIQAIQYPPLLPVLIALQQTVLGERDPFVTGRHLRLIYATLFLAYLVAIHHFSKRYLPTSWALIASIMAALFLQTYYLSNLAFTELPFAFLATVFLLSYLVTVRQLVGWPMCQQGCSALPPFFSGRPALPYLRLGFSRLCWIGVAAW